MRDDMNHSYLSSINYGHGIVAALVDSYTFSDLIMGGSFTVPGPYRQEIYNTEFIVFEEVLKILD